MIDWITILRKYAQETSNAAAARKIGYSQSVISQVLGGTYRGNLEAVRQKVLDHLGGGTVACPILGEIDLTRCAAERTRPFAATNPLRVRLWRCCQTCINNPNRKPEN